MYFVLQAHIFALVDIVIVVNMCFICLLLALGIVRQFVIARLIVDIIGDIATLTGLVDFFIPEPLPLIFSSVEFGDFEDGPALSFELLESWHGVRDSRRRLGCRVSGWS